MTDSGGGASKQSDVEMEGLEWGNDDDDDQYTYFCPLSHPIEPQDEDRPVKCPPLSQSSTTILMDNNDIETAVQNEESTMELKKRAEKATYFDTPPRRQLRKRHHALTCGDIIFTPPQRTPPPFSFPTKDTDVVLQMFEHLDKFEA